MEFSYELTIPAGTTQTSPATIDCQLSAGIIHQYSVTFLEGCNGLVSVAAFNGGSQCFPLNLDGAIKGNAETVKKTTFYPLDARPFKLVVKGFSPDCTYAHTVFLRFDVLPLEYFNRSREIQEVIEAVSKELQREYIETADVMAERMELLTKQITPRTAAAGEDLEDLPAEPEEKEPGILDQITDLDKAILLAQIRQGWNNDRIIIANTSNVRLDPEKLPDILEALREVISNG